MHYSEFIASLMGPLLLMNATAILTNPKGYQGVIAGAARNPAIVYLTGLLMLLGGLVVVRFHNVWTIGWPVLITLGGWLAVLGGIVRMAVPNRISALGERMANRRKWLIASGVVSAVIGVFLTIKGF